jgi:transcriptional regulator with XRE-family HTH domain
MNEKVLLEARKMIAGFIKNRRNELEITQQELADKCGVGVNTIRRMEDARFWPNLKQMLTICNALDLFFFVEEKESTKPLATSMRERWGKVSPN